MSEDKIMETFEKTMSPEEIEYRKEYEKILEVKERSYNDLQEHFDELGEVAKGHQARIAQLSEQNEQLAQSVLEATKEIESLHMRRADLRQQWIAAVDQFGKWVDMSFEEFRQGKMDMPQLQISMKVLPYPPPEDKSPGEEFAERNEIQEL